MSRPLAIACRNLIKTYPGKPPVEAVRGVDLHVEQGECFGVLGPNGAGKTTTIEILEGLVEATSGEVEILGRRWDQHPHEIRQQIGVSLQETRLSERLTVRETLEMFRSFYRHGMTVDECIDSVSLREKQHSWIKKLSGGQQQRLAVATALIGDPQLLFLDEPTTGLDPASRRDLWDVIRGFRNRGRTVLLTTHYMEEAERLCDRVAIFDQGKVIALGTPRELVASLGAGHVIEFSLEEHELAAAEEHEAGERHPVPDTAWLATLPSVDRFDRRDGLFRLTAQHPHLVLPELMGELSRREMAMSSLTTRHASLEDVFVSLTGRQLSDESAPQQEK